VGDPLPRILAGSVEQHSHLDGLLLHRPLPTVGETIAPRTLWGAVFIGLLAATFLAFYIPLVKRQDDASRGVKRK
jgi:hypothetical protein